MELAGQVALKRAEAIAREFSKEIHLVMVRARSLEEALFDITKSHEYDLVVVGLHKRDFLSARFSSHAKKFLKHAPCRVVFCKS
jgi:nucleotide-binding universal stress UspA family protein